jgi:hypothetical protein
LMIFSATSRRSAKLSLGGRSGMVIGWFVVFRDGVWALVKPGTTAKELIAGAFPQHAPNGAGGKWGVDLPTWRRARTEMGGQVTTPFQGGRKSSIVLTMLKLRPNARLSTPGALS